MITSGIFVKNGSPSSSALTLKAEAAAAAAAAAAVVSDDTASTSGDEDASSVSSSSGGSALPDIASSLMTRTSYMQPMKLKPTLEKSVSSSQSYRRIDTIHNAITMDLFEYGGSSVGVYHRNNERDDDDDDVSIISISNCSISSDICAADMIESAASNTTCNAMATTTTSNMAIERNSVINSKHFHRVSLDHSLTSLLEPDFTNSNAAQQKNTEEYETMMMNLGDDGVSDGGGGGGGGCGGGESSVDINIDDDDLFADLEAAHLNAQVIDDDNISFDDDNDYDVSMDVKDILSSNITSSRSSALREQHKYEEEYKHKYVNRQHPASLRQHYDDKKRRQDKFNNRALIPCGSSGNRKINTAAAPIHCRSISSSIKAATLSHCRSISSSKAATPIHCRSHGSSSSSIKRKYAVEAQQQRLRKQQRKKMNDIDDIEDRWNDEFEKREDDVRISVARELPISCKYYALLSSKTRPALQRLRRRMIKDHRRKMKNKKCSIHSRSIGSTRFKHAINNTADAAITAKSHIAANDRYFPTMKAMIATKSRPDAVASARAFIPTKKPMIATSARHIASANTFTVRTMSSSSALRSPPCAFATTAATKPFGVVTTLPSMKKTISSNISKTAGANTAPTQRAFTTNTTQSLPNPNSFVPWKKTTITSNNKYCKTGTPSGTRPPTSLPSSSILPRVIATTATKASVAANTNPSIPYLKMTTTNNNNHRIPPTATSKTASSSSSSPRSAITTNTTKAPLAANANASFIPPQKMTTTSYINNNNNQTSSKTTERNTSSPFFSCAKGMKPVHYYTLRNFHYCMYRSQRTRRYLFANVQRTKQIIAAATKEEAEAYNKVASSNNNASGATTATSTTKTTMMAAVQAERQQQRNNQLLLRRRRQWSAQLEYGTKILTSTEKSANDILDVLEYEYINKHKKKKNLVIVQPPLTPSASPSPSPSPPTKKAEVAPRVVSPLSSDHLLFPNP